MNNLEDNDTLTQCIIGCAIEVHHTLGPGLLESAYELLESVDGLVVTGPTYTNINDFRAVMVER